jgi:protein-S-isoprenylcysteine O-methyltransferase Ste14
VIALPPLVYLGFLLLGILTDLIWPTTLGAFPTRLVLGGAFLATGLVLAAWAVRTFARAGTHVEVYRPATVLVTQGPYRLSRNPIYLGLSVAHVGAAILANSLWALLLLLPALALIRYGVIAREEEYLERRFGEAYRRYKNAVRRWI